MAWGHLALAGGFGHTVAPVGTRSGDTQPQAGSTACSGADCAVKKPRIYRVLPQFRATLQGSPLAPSDPVLGRSTPGHGIPGGMGDTGEPGETLRGCQGGLWGHRAEFPTGPPPSGSATAELHTARREPGENHKSRGYTRAFSRAVFDRDTKFNFLRRALNPRLSPRGRLWPTPAPHPTLPGGPPAPHHSTAGGCKDRG